MTGSAAAGIDEAIESLLARAGIETTVVSVESCATGGNNRTYRVVTAAGTFAAKQYFRDARDRRDRLASEYSFLEYAASVAAGSTPRPYARDDDAGLALYEFVEGRRFAPGAIAWPEVGTAADFFVALNQPAARATAGKLPVAAEACFSIAAHLDLVRDRIEALRAAPAGDAADREAKAIVDDLSRCFDVIADGVSRSQGGADDVARPLSDEQRCVSPSDFGFHNALAEEGGAIRFLDFEYAGWDDPAKMTGDFFAQLAVPVPQDLFERFARRAMEPFAGADDLVRRAALLRPVYRLKWCCIALNVFLAPSLARRRFANPEIDEAALKAAQLAKARTLLQSTKESL